MYKLLRPLMDMADQVGQVEDLHWYKLGTQEWVTISGITSEGKKFELRLEEEKDGT